MVTLVNTPSYGAAKRPWIRVQSKRMNERRSMMAGRFKRLKLLTELPKAGHAMDLYFPRHPDRVFLLQMRDCKEQRASKLMDKQ